MNITDALKNVKEAALEGRNLEAWQDGEDGWLVRYELEGEFQYWRIWCRGKRHYKYDSFDTEFSTEQVLGVWHVREVTNG